MPKKTKSSARLQREIDEALRASDREQLAREPEEPRVPGTQERIGALGRSIMSSQHHGRDATSETTPWHIWQSSVLEIAGVSHAEKDRYARAHLQRAYDAGEPAWMAADMVRLRVRGGLLADREDGEISSMRRAVAGVAPRTRKKPR